MRLIGAYVGQVKQPVIIAVSLREIGRPNLRKAVSQYLCHGLASMTFFN